MNINSSKYKVLNIAKNVPVPKRLDNPILLEITKKLSDKFDFNFIFPLEYIPFFLKKNKKYNYLPSKPLTYYGYHFQPIKYLKIPGYKFAFTLFSRKNKKLDLFIKNNGPFSLTHSHYVMPDGYFALHLKEVNNTPYIVTVRSADLLYLDKHNKNSFDEKKFDLVLKNASSIITHNSSTQNILLKKGYHSTLIPHGLDEEFYNDSLIIGDEINICVVSSFMKSKNIPWVIKAIDEYLGDKKINVTIVGEGEDSNNIQSLIKNSKQKFTLIQSLKRFEVIELLRKSNIFALPSERETFGLVYLEAAANDNAIIGFKNQGVYGVFEEGKEMLYCDNFENFKEQLFFLIENADSRIKMTIAAKHKATKLMWKNIIPIYEELYFSAIKNE